MTKMPPIIDVWELVKMPSNKGVSTLPKVMYVPHKMMKMLAVRTNWQFFDSILMSSQMPSYDSCLKVRAN